MLSYKSVRGCGMCNEMCRDAVSESVQRRGAFAVI